MINIVTAYYEYDGRIDDEVVEVDPADMEKALYYLGIDDHHSLVQIEIAKKAYP